MANFEQYAPDILQIAKRHGVHNIRVFGSFADGSSTPSSDLDLLVNLEPGRDLLDLIALKQELEELIFRKVDIVTENALSPHLRQNILRQAKAL